MGIIIGRLKSLQRYEIEDWPDGFGGSTLEVDARDDDRGEWIKVEDLRKIIKEEEGWF